MIEVKNLHISYYGKEVVSNINFHFEEGSSIGIIGPNGAGKSTMIKGILGLIPIDKGEIYVDGKPIKENIKRVAYVPQYNDIDWDFPIDVFNTVLMGTYPSLGLIKRPGEKEKQLARQSLERVNMLDFADNQIGELSGGQKQRIFIARALAQEADIFFLDEPFIGIDMMSEEKIVKVLDELKREGKTIFVVNHDLSKVQSYFDELILINKHLIKCGPVEDVFVYDAITEAYETNFQIPGSQRVEKQNRVHKDQHQTDFRRVQTKEVLK